MRNKKGFTLTELLAIIAILSIILLIAFPIYSRIKDSLLDKSYANLISYIETGAEKYANETGNIVVNVDTLIKNGYIEADDDLANIYNPINQNILNCYVINITETEDGYVAIFDGTGPKKSDDGSCDENVLTLGNMSILCNGVECKNTWYQGSNSSFKLSIKQDENYNFDLSKDIPTWSNLAGLRDKTQQTLDINVENGKIIDTIYNAVIYKSDKTYRASQSIKIDYQKPKVTKISISDEKVWSVNKKVTITASDGSGSGIDSFAIVESTASCGNYGKPTKNNSYTKTITENATYKICVKDKVGNVYDSSKDADPNGSGAGSIQTIKIENIDDLPPKVNSDYVKEWKKTITITGKLVDNETGVQFWTVTETKNENCNSETAPNNFAKEISKVKAKSTTTINYDVTKNATYCVWAKDVAGNVSVSTTKVEHIDIYAPTITDKTVQTGEPVKASVTIQATLNDVGIGVQYYAVTRTSAQPTSWTKITKSNSYDLKYTVKENGYYYIWAKDALDNISSYKRIKITDIDAIAPTITINADQSDWVKELTLNITLTDNETGVQYYAITTDSSTPEDSEWTKINVTKTYNLTHTVYEKGYYYVWAKDVVGNYTYKYKSVYMIDNEPPYLTEYSTRVACYPHDAYYYYSVDLRVNDNGAGVDADGDGYIDEGLLYYVYRPNPYATPTKWYDSYYENGLTCGRHYYYWFKISDILGNEAIISVARDYPDFITEDTELYCPCSEVEEEEDDDDSGGNLSGGNSGSEEEEETTTSSYCTSGTKLCHTSFLTGCWCYKGNDSYDRVSMDGGLCPDGSHGPYSSTSSSTIGYCCETGYTFNDGSWKTESGSSFSYACMKSIGSPVCPSGKTLSVNKKTCS